MEPHVFLVVCLAFFGIALVYASVRFGGGSSYTALLALTGGQIGSHWGAGILPQVKLRRITACLILFVSIRALSGIYFL